MVIGIPREIKEGEGRVGMVPAGAAALRQAGHTVLVEAGAGRRSRFSDREYRQAGARIVRQAAEVWRRAEMIVKVKEPLPPEYGLMRRGQVLFTFLHLAAARGLAKALMAAGTTAVGYETMEAQDGSLPLLAPMSEIAGKLSVQMGAHLLQAWCGGRGTLLAGAAGVPPGIVSILGAGTAGRSAAAVAHGMGARVTVLDVRQEALDRVRRALGDAVDVEVASAATIASAVERADLLITAALVPGARAPKLVTREMVRRMKPGAVIVDVSIDQGGCVEGIRATTPAEPAFVRSGVLHAAVTNLPSAVPRTATKALTSATLPWVLKIANQGIARAAREDAMLARGVNVAAGRVVHEAVARALGVRPARLEDVLPGGG